MASKQNFSDRLSGLLSHGKKGKLAAFCGVEASTVSRWINGQTTPTGESYFKIAEFLGVDAKWLISGETAKRSANLNELGDANTARSLVRKSPMGDKNPGKVEMHTHLQMVNKALADMHGTDEITHSNIVSDDVQIYGAKTEPTLADAFALLRKAIDILETITTKQKL